MICETYEQDHSQTDFCDFGFCLREIIAPFLDSEKKEEKKEGGWGGGWMGSHVRHLFVLLRLVKICMMKTSIRTVINELSLSCTRSYQFW